ncbi:MAG: hypothetical protein Salg2KO_02950 [Salibacteraceae bacterium]
MVISRIINEIRNLCTSEHQAPSLQDEIRLMNVTSLASMFLTFSTGVAGLVVFPDHGQFIAAVAFSEMIAKAAVLLMHQLKKYLVAKIIFSYTTLILFLLIIKYFGMVSNFQYLILTTFFTLIAIYRNTTLSDLFITGTYLTVGIFSCLFLYLEGDPVVVLSEAEMKKIRVIAYTVNFSLVTMVAIVFFFSSRRRRVMDEDSARDFNTIASTLQTISENLEVGIFRAEKESGLKYVNTAFIHLFGYKNKEHFRELRDVTMLYDSMIERQEVLTELEVKGSVTNRMVRYRRYDDTRFWGHLTCKLIKEDGVEYMVGTIADASVQYSMEAQHKDLERQLKTAQRMAKIGDWQLFNANKIMRWSDEALHIHGYPLSETDHDMDDWIDRLDDLNLRQLDTLMAKAMVTNENVTFRSWFTTPAGEHKYLLYTTRYQRSDKIKGGIWHGTVQDWTVQYNAELKAAETQRFYEEWLNELPIESVMFDDQLKFQFISKSAIRDPKRRAYFIGKGNMDYIRERGLPEEEFKERDEKLKEVFDTNEPLSYDEKMMDKEGRMKYHRRFLFPIEIVSNGQLKRSVVSYSLDITDMVELQKALDAVDQS